MGWMRVGLAIATAGALIAAAPTQASNINLCVPTAAGQPVVSNGSATTCVTGSLPLRMPAAPSEQQRLLYLAKYMQYISPTAGGIGGKPTIRFSGVNVQIVNGSGQTQTVNGAGNLVLGYNESPGTQTGSHDLVLGYNQTYTDAGQLVAGRGNTATGPWASVFGQFNTASGYASAVGGGQYNSATGDSSVAAGGRGNTASGTFGTAVGGATNAASATESTALGGWKNKATAHWSTAAGGCYNLAGPGTLPAPSDAFCPDDNASSYAVGDAASTFGGMLNQSSATLGSSLGGMQNVAGGRRSTALGGSGHSTSVLDGVTGRRETHWVRVDANGALAKSSDADTEFYAGADYSLVKWPGVTLDDCAVTVQATNNDSPVVATYSNYYNYIYARLKTRDAAGNYLSARGPIDIIASCGT